LISISKKPASLADHDFRHRHRCLWPYSVWSDRAAFWNSVRHAKPLTIGLNCALGAALMRPYAEELSKIADTFVCIYPNAGLPNPMSDTGFDELPADTSALLKEFAEAGFINIAGGCCGTTPRTSRRLPISCKPSTRADSGNCTGDVVCRAGTFHHR
jgi:hypothetical protein